MDRRQFITVSAALAAGAPKLPAAAASNVQSDTGKKCGTNGCDYDVIVVGGGFAGATAARDSAKNSYRTLLLEARN